MITEISSASRAERIEHFTALHRFYQSVCVKYPRKANRSRESRYKALLEAELAK